MLFPVVVLSLFGCCRSGFDWKFPSRGPKEEIAHNKDGICNPNLPRSTSSRQALSLCTQSLIHVFCT
uniref:Secreted protein n=1 Tax=Oryza meridionalis TaxID=40149 RepID=A0A0E0EIU6_9ORYZ